MGKLSKSCRLLCGHEEGWHLVPKPLSLFTNTAEEIIDTITEAAPFLARFYAILKQSSVKLKCLNGQLGESFMNFLDQEGKTTSNFLMAYMAVHKLVSSHVENEEFIRQLDRCHLPSGKVAWLCEKHSKGNRITKLGVGSISVHGQGQTILNKEDELMREYLKTSPIASALMGRPDRETSSLNTERQPSMIKEQSNVSVVIEKEEIKETARSKQNGDIAEGKPTASKKKTAEDKGKTSQTPKGKQSIDKKKGDDKTEEKSDNSAPQSPSSSTSSTSMSQVAGTVRKLQRNYSKSGRQKSQACVLQ
ncbi:uncharacterized protein LOC134239046 [Saccostrea cucullata]|uniref:uncharacterized protein LOC134239046 n=1 Tax=Saccostrea cuccullata TaxID=36930 RepID=UPI002ED5926E